MSFVENIRTRQTAGRRLPQGRCRQGQREAHRSGRAGQDVAANEAADKAKAAGADLKVKAVEARTAVQERIASKTAAPAEAATEAAE